MCRPHQPGPGLPVLQRKQRTPAQSRRRYSAPHRGGAGALNTSITARRSALDSSSTHQDRTGHVRVAPNQSRRSPCLPTVELGCPGPSLPTAPAADQRQYVAIVAGPSAYASTQGEGVSKSTTLPGPRLSIPSVATCDQSWGPATARVGHRLVTDALRESGTAQHWAPGKCVQFLRISSASIARERRSSAVGDSQSHVRVA